MKKRVIGKILICLSVLCLGLAGCGEKEANVSVETSSVSEEATAIVEATTEVVTTEASSEVIEEVELDPLIKPEIDKFRNMTYASFKEETGKDVELLHSNRYACYLDNIGVIIEATEYDSQDFTTTLSDEDVVIRVEGKASDMINYIDDENDPFEFGVKLSEDIGIDCVVEFCEGVPTAYYISENYFLYSCDLDKDGFIDTEIHIDSLDNTISKDSNVWVVFYDNLVPMSSVGFRAVEDKN